MNKLVRNKQGISIFLLFIMLFSFLPTEIVAADENNKEEYVYEDENKTIIKDYRGSSKSIEIPDQVKVIRNSAFKDKGITSIKLNEGLEVIENAAFSSNEIKGKVVLPSSLKELGSYAFSNNKIEEIDLKNLNESIFLGSSIFQDNKISGVLDLRNLKEIPKRMFMSNEIENVMFSSKLEAIKREAFVANKLSQVSITSNNVELEEDVFASNGRFVEVVSNSVDSEKSIGHSYGHIVNPVNIVIRSVEKQKDGSLKKILSDKRVEFDPYNADNFFVLNHESFYEPDYVLGYTIDEDMHPERLISFVPDKNNFILDVYYKKIPNPEIKINKNAVRNLLNNKKEGSDINEEDLLSLVKAYDYLGDDISKDIKVSPKEIINAEAKEYTIVYSVSDAGGRTVDYKLNLPVDIDPLKIRIAGTEWRLEDFIYEGNVVVDLSERGKEKAKLIPGVAIPHMNPYTMETIEIVRFRDGEEHYSKLKDHIQEGDLVFGDPESIKLIDDYSFGSRYSRDAVKISGSLPEMSNLEYVGKHAFDGTELSGLLREMPKLEYIEDYAFFGSNINGLLPDMPKLKNIGNRAFQRTKISGFSTEMSNLKHIGDWAFYETQLSGLLPETPKLEEIGEHAFYKTQVSGFPAEIPNLKHIGDHAFVGTDISGSLPETPNLEHIGSYAFSNTKLSGSFPEMPNLEYIGDHAFKYTYLSGFPAEIPNLEYIGGFAFYRTQLSGPLPEMPELKYIGGFAFEGTQINGSLPEMPKLEHLGNSAFSETQLSGLLPEMPKLEHLGNYTFKDTEIIGSLPEMPNLKHIGNGTFYETQISGSLPEMPKLNHIGAYAFEDTQLSGSFPEMPNLEYIGREAFKGTQLSGPLPEMPKLEYVGNRAFINTQILKDEPFYINNNIEVDESSFKLSDDDDKQMVLLTYNGEDAPNVPLSNYHILNPYNIGFIGKDKEGNIVVEETRILATEGDGSSVRFKLPEVEGFVDSKDITILKSDLEDGVYTHIYKSIKEELDEKGGNKYQFTFKPTNSKIYYNDNETINAYLSMSTVSEDILKDGKIELKYDESTYKDFFIPEIKGVKNINYQKGKVVIELENNLSQGTEIGLPISFQFNKGVLPESLFSIKAYLFDGKDVKGYEEIEYGVNYKEPQYSSVFSNNNKTRYENIVVKDLKDDYNRTITLYPEVSSFIRDFNSFRVEYDEIKYKNKNGLIKTAILLSSNWKHENGKYVYEVKNFKGQVDIPKLKLEFENPASTEKAIVINSKAIADVNTSLKEYEYVEMNDVNYLNIHTEERRGSVLIKSISNPHSNNRQAYFYDNIEERNHNFEWSLSYNITYDIDELTLTDYELDERMQYTAIDPNGDRVLVRLLDKDENVLSEKVIREKTQIEENLQDEVRFIELKYFNLKDGHSVNPKIITKLKDINRDYFDPSNVNNVNRFYNKMKTRAVDTNGKAMVGNDFAFVNVVKDNKKLATEVKVTSKPVDLSYGKTANSSFYLKSKEYFNKNINELKYTALVNQAHRLEDIILNPELVGQYEISQTKNGYTKIDFIFEDLDAKLNSSDSRFKLFDLKTTPKDKSSQDLKVYGFLDSSKEFEIYGQGEGILEGLDKSQFSYDKTQEKIINGEFFSIQKLIGKGEEVSTRIETEEGEAFFYRFEIDNGTTTKRENFELIDILPFENDFNYSNYHNKVDVEKLKNIKLPSGFKIEYLNQKDFIKVSKEDIIEKLSNKNWTSTPTEDTKAIKITADVLKAKGDLIQIDIPMITKTNLKVEDNLKVNTNQFTYTHDALGYKQALSNPVEQLAKVKVPKKNIKLKKVSIFMGEEDGVLEGIKFVLKDSLGKIVDSGSTDSNGNLTFKDIPVGDYTVEEVNIPEGYKGKTTIVVRAEDMNKATTTLDLGKVENHRIDSFNYLFKNVEFIGDLNSIEYRELKNIYSREIGGAEFVITNKKTGEKQTVMPRKSGVKIKLQPGIHTIEQTITSKDNGLAYKLNSIKYQFEIDKFGNILLGDGSGSSLINKKEEILNVIYFPNTVDYKTSTVNIKKLDENGNNLEGAEFTLQNIETGESVKATSDKNGFISFKNIKPGLYSIKETKAPQGYVSTGQIEIIDVPIDEEKIFDFVFTNQKIRVNIHKYKVVADKLLNKTQAEEIAKNSVSSTGGKFIVKDLGDYFQVREVWKDNNISVNGKTFSTDTDGSIYDIQNSINVDIDTVLNIRNNTKIKNHYEPDLLEEYISNYTSQENFNGVIDIDIEVKPLKGTIYVSKYLIDKNNEEGVKEGTYTNGAKYTLYVDKGHGFEEMSTKKIDNSNYVVFKDLDPNYSYKVKEVYVPEGQEESQIKEYDVELNELNKYTSTVIFKNYIERKTGTIFINKVDGRNDKALSNVVFTITDRFGQTEEYTTNENGSITIDELEYDRAPYTIKEIKAAPGYRLPSQTITVTEDDILNEKIFVVKNYKYNETPKTGTSGKLPFFIMSIPLILLAYIFNKNKEYI